MGYGHRELWLLQDVGPPPLRSTLPEEGLKAIFSRTLGPRVVDTSPTTAQPSPVVQAASAIGIAATASRGPALRTQPPVQLAGSQTGLRGQLQPQQQQWAM